MGELVVVSSELELQWTRMKHGIHLANRVSTSEDHRSTFGTVLRRAIDDSVGRCRVQRKRARESETPSDTSDAAIVRAARFTDVLPLDDYDNILHLVPRLVNVVTVSRRKPPRAASCCTALRAASCTAPRAASCTAASAASCTAVESARTRAVGRGHPRSGVGHQAAARPARHRLALQQFLLRATPVCGGAARL